MTTAPISHPAPRKAPPFLLSLSLCLVITVFFAWMRLAVYPDRVFPLSSALPLLLCLWNRDRRLLYGMGIAFSAITLAKVFLIQPSGGVTHYEVVTLVSQFINIWVVVAVIHGLLRARRRIEQKNLQLEEINGELEASNEELSASNEELAAREEEISRQNEELQSQTEELEQQAEELRQQAEEMEQQSTELHEVNQELSRREKALQTLLNSSRWLHKDATEATGMGGVCQAALQIMAEDVHAVDVSADTEGLYAVWGEVGFGMHGMVNPDFAFADSFPSLAVESGRTIAIEDLDTRPDLQIPVPQTGRPFRSALATPIWNNGKVQAVLCLYSHQTRRWTEHDFNVVEWLAGQAGMTLQSIRFRQELNTKRHEAEKAAVQKSRFLAAVSHDVRTPANSISLLAELIDRSAADPARSAQVPVLAKSLWNNARALVDLVSDVLDLTRMDSGISDVQVTEFNLDELLCGEIERAGVIARTKGITLEQDLPGGNLVLATDRTKVSRVISNLLSNAVKFTDAGHVRVRCLKLEDGGLQIEVKDTGVGIPVDSLEHVFDEFFQLRNPERDKEKGAGLGLAICQRLAASLDCRITVQSAVGVGSTFTLHLPPSSIRSHGHPLPDPAQNARPVTPLTGVRILLVEDNHVARNAVSDLLTAEGALVTAAANGQEALDHLAGNRHDTLLLDLNLPDMDGSEILKSLQDQRPPALKTILVVTGDARPERIEQIKELGAHGLVAKPVSLETLRQAISLAGAETLAG